MIKMHVEEIEDGIAYGVPACCGADIAVGVILWSAAHRRAVARLSSAWCQIAAAMQS
jgi:hypothetical protein